MRSPIRKEDHDLPRPAHRIRLRPLDWQECKLLTALIKKEPTRTSAAQGKGQYVPGTQGLRRVSRARRPVQHALFPWLGNHLLGSADITLSCRSTSMPFNGERHGRIRNPSTTLHWLRMAVSATGARPAALSCASCAVLAGRLPDTSAPLACNSPQCPSAATSNGHAHAVALVPVRQHSALTAKFHVVVGPGLVTQGTCTHAHRGQRTPPPPTPSRPCSAPAACALVRSPLFSQCLFSERFILWSADAGIGDGELTARFMPCFPPGLEQKFDLPSNQGSWRDSTVKGQLEAFVQRPGDFRPIGYV